MTVASSGTVTATAYYHFNGQPVAMRTGGTLTHLHTDHLGSIALTTGGSTVEQRYFAYGRKRTGGDLPSEHNYTGQRKDASGLLYYNARYYDPQLGTFISPDTIVPEPGNLLDYNRYMYTRGNPLKYNDPSGHCATTEDGGQDRVNDLKCWTMIDSILNVWDETDYWSRQWPDKEAFEEHVAAVPDFDRDFWFKALNEYYEFKNTWDAEQAAQKRTQIEERSPGSGYCSRENDYCVPIANDAVGVGTTLAIAVVCIPGAAACATVSGVGGTIATISTVGGAAWTSFNWYQNDENVTDADMAVNMITAGASIITSGTASPVVDDVAQVVYAAFQLLWDIQ